jgi:hypothetical protein
LNLSPIPRARFLSLLFAVPLLALFACRPAPEASTASQATAADPVPRHLRVVWTERPDVHAIVSWSTLAPATGGSLRYDTVSRGDATSGEAYAFSAPVARTGPITMRAEDRAEGVSPAWYHHAQLEGLSPSTRYYFRAENDGRLSPERYFITAPAPDDERSFKLLSGGDSRLGGEKPRYAGRVPHVDRQGMNAAMLRLLEHNPDLLALAHGADWCTTADWRHLYWFFEDNDRIVAPDGRVLPFIVSRGNHDEGIGFQENFWLGDITDAFSYGYYYTTHLGRHLALITLNTEISVAGDQSEWLEEQLVELRPKYRWLMAQYHRPAYPVAKEFERQDFARIRQNFSPLFERFGLDLALESDGHVLKRTVPIRNGRRVSDAEGVVYIGEGGLGVPQREPRPNLWFVEAPGMSASAHHVWLLTVTPGTLRAQAIGMDGAVLDDYSRSPRP